MRLSYSQDAGASKFSKHYNLINFTHDRRRPEKGELTGGNLVAAVRQSAAAS